ncbi:hypothetical protein HNR00_003571 [Methylorubrum rhodinum]|uniref:Uncharacterized protein n=1 Tax=Methylorubrum rhodinum TaxID=29428 RepID=A0A840ZNV6_9HYPH|nr:hypothetical protein [Methylorubrum rhodinum]MBB5758844.1 hypothetical protein [Methylorubrum rhodinum]
MARTSKGKAGPLAATGVSSAVRKAFNEMLHPRGPRGQFKDKPGAGNDAPKAPRKPRAAAPKKALAGETALKTSGVSADDTIEVLSKRVRAYQGKATVQEFVETHPKGRAYALRKLAADQKKGVIGFKGAEQAAASPPSPAASRPESPPPPRPSVPKSSSGGWAGAAAQRDISGDTVTIGDRTLDQGLFRDEAQLREATSSFLSGVPKEEKLSVIWAPGARPNSLVMVASNAKGTAKVTRNFIREGNTWVVRHTYFELPKKYQGGGNAKTMLRSSVEAYDRIGVARIDAHANLNVGGYAWARLGFAPDRPTVVREALEMAVRRAPRTPHAQATRVILDTSSDDDLMHNLARARGADGEPLGRKILGPKADWDGHLDLKNARHRERLNGNFA